MGMPEYRDGTFGPIKQIEEALDDLCDPAEIRRTKALHIWKAEELLARAERPTSGDEPLARILQEEVDRLRRDVNLIKARLFLES